MISTFTICMFFSMSNLIQTLNITYHLRRKKSTSHKTRIKNPNAYKFQIINIYFHHFTYKIIDKLKELSKETKNIFKLRIGQDLQVAGDINSSEGTTYKFNSNNSCLS